MRGKNLLDILNNYKHQRKAFVKLFPGNSGMLMRKKWV